MDKLWKVSSEAELGLLVSSACQLNSMRTTKEEADSYILELDLSRIGLEEDVG